MANPFPCSDKIWLSKFFLGFCCLSALVSSQCLEDQKLLLLEFKQGLSINLQRGSKLLSWSPTSDCCSWDGVTCDAGTGHVISLDISNSSITGGINSSSSLFSLHHLRHLNLAYNFLSPSPFPLSFDRLLNLTYLNLSYSGFSGQVPLGISFLKALILLDLSTYSWSGMESVKLKNPNLEQLVKNLTNLEVLYLNGIDISMSSKGGQILSTLSNLRMLSLSYCNLVGPMHSSLSKLQLLSHLNLNGNNFNQGVPDFLSSFSSLKYLDLSSCLLYGTFPESIFLMPSLCYLDISYNPHLSGSLPEFPPSSQLQVIKLSETRFSGKLPDSINNLASLKDLQLSYCNFSGSIPSSFEELTELINLDLSRNNFSGSLPLLASSKKVISLTFSHNCFSGIIPLSYGDGLNSLETLNLRNNSLKGNIPVSIFTKQSIKVLLLDQNKLDGQLKEFQNASSSSLREIDLSQNKLQGSVPMSFFEIRGLIHLSLSSNNFTGSITIDMLKDLKELTTLDLSGISFSFSGNGSNSMILPKIGKLYLSSCNITEFPSFLRTKINLFHLDLSNNRIRGEIPNWFWELGNGNLVYLNLSHNMLQAFEKPSLNLSSSSLAVLDLHSNMFNGSILIPPSFITFLDYSENKFTSTIPSTIGNYLSYAIFVSFSSNNLGGEIPASLCEAFNLQVLDLSGNHFNGSIPPCLVSNDFLKILKLQNNEFRGMVPQVLGEECDLRTLDVSRNHLEGSLPRSLLSCRNLGVLNVGENQLNGSFPFWLETLPQLRVLVLRSNNFGGSINYSQSGNTFAKLQIIDLSSNNFRGNLPYKWFQSWKGMKKKANESKVSQILEFTYLQLSNSKYKDSVTLMNKGQFMKLVKILTVFTSIDLANNQFEGEIPDTLGDLDSLYVLNMSNNHLKGQIPATFGKLKELGSLDLSQNQLSGNIPQQLASLTFLSVLNLSQNLLVGEIPRGSQLDTFTEASFEGNIGLCGFQLAKACHDASPPMEPITTNTGNSESDLFIDWEFFWIGFGFGGGAGMSIGIITGLAIGNVIFKKTRRDRKQVIQRRRN